MLVSRAESTFTPTSFADTRLPSADKPMWLLPIVAVRASCTHTATPSPCAREKLPKAMPEISTSPKLPGPNTCMPATKPLSGIWLPSSWIRRVKEKAFVVGATAPGWLKPRMRTPPR